MTEQPLNAGQQAAADGFFDFLFSKDKEMGITGPGGVGKTHLMGYMIDKIMPRYQETCKLMGIKPEYDEVHMTATTNKAAEVLGSNTGRPASTIHSHMNLTVKEDFKTGKSLLTPTRQWKVHERQVLFIDEGSMIDSPLDAKIHEGTQNCKIVYVGDHCQLAPVMEPISPIYRREYTTYELTEPMRTQDPHLQALNLQLRTTVETGEFKPIQIVPGVIDHLNDGEMQEAIEYLFKEQTDDSRILSYTNRRVMEYSDHIRGLRQLPEEYTEGEFLINNSAIQLKRAMLQVEAQVCIQKINTANIPVVIDQDVTLMVNEVTLVDQFGYPHQNVMLPVDRNHHRDLMRWYANRKNWDRHFHLKKTYPDLRPRDASTTHKAQGSSLDYVLIDLGDISTCHQPDQVARMLYVACSRARKRIFLYGQLAPKYGGLIH